MLMSYIETSNSQLNNELSYKAFAEFIVRFSSLLLKEGTMFSKIPQNVLINIIDNYVISNTINSLKTEI